MYPIGALLSLTGACADVGDQSLKGIELAIEEINKNGGILGRQIKLHLEDTRETNSLNAVTAYRSLTQHQDLQYIIGPSCSPAGLAVAPLAAKNSKILLISPSIGLRQFNEAGQNIFKMWPYDEEGPKLIAEYAWKQGWRRGAIFSSQQAWEEAQGKFFKQAFEVLGGEILEVVNPLPEESDLRSAAQRILTNKPEFIFMCNYVQFDSAAKELVKQGYKGPKIASLMTKEKVKLAQGALEGTVAYGYEPATAEFTEKFRAKYNQDLVSISADTAYDIMHLLARAINDSKTDDLNTVRNRLLATKDYAGASGILSIDTNGGVTKKPILYVVQGPELEKLTE